MALSGAAPELGLDVDTIAARRPEVGRDLLTVIRRATAARPNQRYSSAGELEEALSLQLGRRYPTFTATALAKIVETACDGLRPSRYPLDESATLVSTTVTSSISRPAAHERGKDRPHGTVPVARLMRRRHRWQIGAAIALSIAAGGLTIHLRRNQRLVPVAPVVERPATSTARVPEALPAVDPPADVPPSMVQHLAAPAPRTKHTAPTATRMGRLSVYSQPWGVVYVDGRRFAELTPVLGVPIPVGVHRVKVFNPDRRSYSPTKTVAVGGSQDRSLAFQW
jgi:hypothetical protein